MDIFIEQHELKVIHKPKAGKRQEPLPKYYCPVNLISSYLRQWKTLLTV